MMRSVSEAFDKALRKTFAEHGEKAMQVEWIEHPLEMLKLVERRCLLPGDASTLTDAELDAKIAKQRARVRKDKPLLIENVVHVPKEEARLGL